MGLCRMAKVLLAGHISEFEPFIEELQFASIIHLVPVTPSTASAGTASVKGAGETSHAELHRELLDTKTFLLKNTPGKGMIEELLTPRQVLTSSDFTQVPSLFNPAGILQQSRELQNRRIALEEERNALSEEKVLLSPLCEIPTVVYRELKTAHTNIVTIICDPGSFNAVSDNELLYTEILARHEDTVIASVAVHIDNLPELEAFLAGNTIRLVEVKEPDTPPAERYRFIETRIDAIDAELDSVAAAISVCGENIDTINTLIDYYETMEIRSTVFEYWSSTENTFLIQGWIKLDDFPACSEMVSRYSTILFEEIPRGEDESPPVAFTNPGVFSPFQLITRLYSFPSSGTFDPSIVLSFFFVIFFGLCLTDAGYGVVLAIAALLGLWKFRHGRELLWIIFWGSLGTIGAGLITGGIFGDLFRTENPFVSLPLMSSMRDSVMIFDPMKNPMSFFRLVLLLGVIQVLTGLLIGVISTARRGSVMDALFDYGTWFVLLLSFLTVLFSTEVCVTLSLIAGSTPPLPGTFTYPAFIIIAVISVFIVLFSARNEKSLFFRFFIGFLNLLVLSGIFSYMGDILSYIRLMALGMVTAGIGMAVNTIAFMMYDIPVAGMVLAAAVLIAGHLFNMLINILGGFVHTLRLQYVEFFSKFFIGGGKPFMPFTYSSTHTILQQSRS